MRVFTDWLLLRRCSLELLGALRGARCSAASASFDQRLVLRFEGAGGARLLAAACFDPTPTVAFVPDLPLEEQPGFGRVLRDRLIGTRVLEVSSRRNDRLLRLRMGTRSRFGVARYHDLVLELVPRFGNALLLNEEGRIVAALQSFDATANARRTTIEGAPYEPPPLDERLRIPRTIARAYGEEAQRIVTEIESSIEKLGDLYVYRDIEGRLLQAHLVPLAVPDAIESREPSILALFAEMQARPHAKGSSQSVATRRERLVARIARRLAADERDAAQILGGLREIGERDSLRAAGEAIYARLHEEPFAARDALKEEARGLFERYRTLGLRAERLEPALARLHARIESARLLQWEASRVEPELLAEVQRSFDTAFEPRTDRTRTRATKAPKRSAPRELRLRPGLRILIGRSPEQNADLTFRIARPDDRWFHAKNIPGAHVVLQCDTEIEEDDEAFGVAADCAALFSHASASARVDIEFTRRKYVRKQRDGAPGLVFYTNARALIGMPERARALLAAMEAEPRTPSN
ncbi:MAG: NFACT family protein [Candidatus Eremiobacteraeota bacterium]|nr:NFACT family protein [Candidatus Eremiobacteraeota bacterium]